MGIAYTRNLSVQLADKSHPAPRHRPQVALRSAPMPLHDGHSFQSESLIALRFVPLHRSPLIVFPQRRLMSVGLYPALPHSVQDVTGTGRFKDMSAPSRTITRKPLHEDWSTRLLACVEVQSREDIVSIKLVLPDVAIADSLQTKTGYQKLLPSTSADAKGRLRTRPLQVMVKDADGEIATCHSVDVKAGAAARQ